jgi:hypothetical protein
MHMDEILSLLFPLFVAGASVSISYYILQCRMEVALAKERELLAEAHATITSLKVTVEERVRAAEESSKRMALDDFMQDFRVEERSYARESRSFNASKKSMVMQERLFFRNIPLSNWIEHEMVVEEGRDLDQLPAKESVFSASTIAPPAPSTSGLAALTVTLNEDLFPPDPPVSLPLTGTEGRLPLTKTLDAFDAAERKPAREKVSPIRARVVAFGAQ